MRNEEDMVIQLINGLSLIGASEECISKAIPLLCLHHFGLCGEPGFSIQPTRSECEDVRDEICKREWNIVEALDIDLPDCTMLQDEASFCPAINDSSSTNATVMGMIKKIITSIYDLFSPFLLPLFLILQL